MNEHRYQSEALPSNLAGQSIWSEDLSEVSSGSGELQKGHFVMIFRSECGGWV